MNKYVSISQAIKHTESLLEGLKQLSSKENHLVHITPNGIHLVIIPISGGSFAIALANDGIVLGNLEDFEGPFKFIGMQSNLAKGGA